jgi:hypothetical protein
MPRFLPVAGLLAAAACTPTLDWRELTVDPTGLHVTFPCKPERAERKVPVTRDKEWLVHAMGCETGGVSYAVLWADVGPTEVATAMAQWKQASTAAARARIEREEPFVPRGALDLPQSVLARAEGRRPDGSALQTQAAYFARGGTVFQATAFGPALKPETTEPFFAGQRFE